MKTFQPVLVQRSEMREQWPEIMLPDFRAIDHDFSSNADVSIRDFILRIERMFPQHLTFSIALTRDSQDRVVGARLELNTEWLKQIEEASSTQDLIRVMHRRFADFQQSMVASQVIEKLNSPLPATGDGLKHINALFSSYDEEARAEGRPTFHDLMLHCFGVKPFGAMLLLR